VRALDERVIGWYRDAERKAQLILTLDGVFLSFLSASAFQASADLRATTARFGPETWVLLGLMAACLTLSIGSAVIALRSRMAPQSKLQRELEQRRPTPHDDATYGPAVTWYFQHLARLDPDALAGTLTRADASFAIQSLAHNLVPLAENVVRKHRWVNRGFFFAGAVLVFFLAAAVSYVTRIATA
jgi:Family of unknown function (DUF5706)